MKQRCHNILIFRHLLYYIFDIQFVRLYVFLADYSPTEIVDMIIIFSNTGGNAREAARQYRDQYPGRRHPDHKVILRAVHRARAGQMQRQRSKKRLDNDDVINVTVLGMVEIDPHISQRQISREVNISEKTVRRILKANSYHPYHISFHQALSDNDFVSGADQVLQMGTGANSTRSHIF